MRIVLVGGTGRIGTRVAAKLVGHDVVVAARSTGVDSASGAGLRDALRGAEVVVDVTRPPISDGAPADAFFRRSTANLLREGRNAGARHHVALTIVGTRRHTDIPYYAAKAMQERLIRGSGTPYTLVHATQFFEFVGEVADAATAGGSVRLPRALVQPMAAGDVADALVRTILATPANDDIEIAGPERFHLDDFVRRALVARNDSRLVLADPRARYFGGRIGMRTLLPGRRAAMSATRFDTLLAELRTSAVTTINPLPEEL
ncbi:SDR family oxidoreductase [Microbacterium lushaniae]|uniref:SDR family oxidoreductase n=1 Tax=Microbacterium lushaniae TaxID=2614639 RepID=UPI001784886E|nr:SDR family oxidoreductase [Microbacterium lushaniae]